MKGKDYKQRPNLPMDFKNYVAKFAPKEITVTPEEKKQEQKILRKYKNKSKNFN